MSDKHYPWAVIGAGAAGIAAVGQLLKNGINEKDIVWCDPAFSAGDLGCYWRTVPSNTIVDFFHRYLKACPAFAYESVMKGMTLDTLPLDQTCLLGHVADVLIRVTDELKKKVPTEQCVVKSFARKDALWHLTTSTKSIMADKLVLATGSVPRELPHKKPEKIALDIALNEERLKAICTPDHTVAVFGNSHSAVLIMRNLVNLGVKRIINLTRQPMKFAMSMGDWILYDNTGLKGEAARWAKEYLFDRVHPSIEIMHSTDEIVADILPSCDFSVDSVGFKAREIQCDQVHSFNHNPHTGIIAPALFGVGIAFPEEVTDPLGNREMNVGLWKFIKFLDRVMPIWIKY